MLHAKITYLKASPEETWNNKKGSFIEVAYQIDLTDMPDDLRKFSYIENIVFVMEWRETVGGEEYLITRHLHSPFPERVVFVDGKDEIVGQRKTFLDRKTFLEWEAAFYNLASLYCRVSLIPVLASTRVSIAMERLTGYYRLIPDTDGSPPLSALTPTVLY